MEDTKEIKNYFTPRELSWLKFNERVLYQALQEEVPPLERLKFISIFSSNLLEFFMVRVGRLSQFMKDAELDIDNKTHLSPKEQLDLILKEVRRLYKLKDEVFFTLEKELRSHGIFNMKFDELNSDEKKYVKQYFKNFIKPVLSPQVISYHKPFPFLENDKPYITVEILSKDEEKQYGMVIVPKNIPKYLVIPNVEGKFKYILTETILKNFSPQIFKNMDISEAVVINITRNEDLTQDDVKNDRTISYKDFTKDILKQRLRLDPVRVESDVKLNDGIKDFLKTKLKLDDDRFFEIESPIQMDYAFSLFDENLPDKESLVYEKYKPVYAQIPKESPSIMREIEKKDYLFTYPFEDMGVFLDLIKEASKDKDVMSIKITIYRLAKHSKLVDYLVQAAENGKNVTVLMELKARFDESHNLDYSKVLYDAGCNIVYGFEGYKVHSKICLITYKKGSEIKTITQIGTGNYNEQTSKIYSDFSLITANSMIGSDATEFFFNICTGIINSTYENLIQSPMNIKKMILEKIEIEKSYKEKGQIILKMNGLTDKEIIDALVDASLEGVRVRLIVRGITALLTGVEGSSENIELISIVGKYLEHARVYMFGKGERLEIYIGSADLMTRNMERRVELAVPILDPNIKNYLKDFLAAQLMDNVKARVQKNDGNYRKKEDGEFDSQIYFEKYFKDMADKLEMREKNKEKKGIFSFLRPKRS